MLRSLSNPRASLRWLKLLGFFVFFRVSLRLTPTGVGVFDEEGRESDSAVDPMAMIGIAEGAKAA